MLEDSQRNWLNKITNKQIVLLGELMVSQQEYDSLKTYFINAVIKSDTTASNANLCISVFLVQIAIREYAEGKYWDSLEKAIGHEVPTTSRTKATGIFYHTLWKYHLFMLPKTGRKVQYIEMIKAHAFVTNHYMNGFFDFINAYFETILFRQIDRNDISEDLKALSDYMQEKLENGDVLSIDSRNGKVPKTYRLLKSTRSVIAYIDNQTLTGLLYPILKAVDAYYYDSVLPKKNDNRFDSSFSRWCALQESVNAEKKKNHTRKISSRKPYIYINRRGETELVIPEQKFRPNEYDSKAKVRIVYGEDEEEMSFNLDVFPQWGLYISDPKCIRIPSAFEHMDIYVCGSSDACTREYHISEALYRILDANNKETRHLRNGNNGLLVSKHIKPVFNDKVELINKHPHGDWVLYSVNCSLGAEITIGNQTLRFTNTDYTDAEYENEENAETNVNFYTVSDEDGNAVKCTKKHPVITIYTSRDYENGIAIRVNHEKWALREIIENYDDAIVRDIDACFNNKVKIMINLEKLYYSAVGYFEVCADIPTKGIHEICKYICIADDLMVKRNKKMYYAEQKLAIQIIQDIDSDLRFDPLFPCDTSYTLEKDYERITTFHSSCNLIESQADFSFWLDQSEFVLHVPVPKFEFGASSETLACRKTILWYKEIPDNFYISIPGALDSRIEFKWDNRIYVAKGVPLECSIFRFDMKEINEVIRSVTNRSNMYISVLFFDGKNSNTSFMIHRQFKVEPYFTPESIAFQPEEKQMYITIDHILFHEKATLFLEIEDRVNNEIIFDGAISEGTNVIKHIDSCRSYTLRPYMVERNGFFGTNKTPMRWVQIEGEKSIADLSKYYVRIKSIQHNGNILKTPDFVYGIDYIRKVDDYGDYIGRLYAASYVNNKPDFKNITIIGRAALHVFKTERNSPVCTISMLEESSGEYVELYYDKTRSILISPNNKLISSNNQGMKSRDYDRFLTLWEDETVFYLDLRLRKERKNVIQTN